MSYRLRFGGYDFPLTIRPAGEQLSQDTGAQARPRGSGSVTRQGRTEPSIRTLRGDLIGSTPADLAAQHHALLAAVRSGKQIFWFGTDAEYFKDAQLKSLATDYNEGLLFGLTASYSITFEAADYPEAYGTATQSPALTATGGTILVLGNSLAAPTWQITIDDAGDGPLVLTNSTTGEQAYLSRATGFEAGDVITLYRDGYKVIRNTVQSFGLLGGRIPSLTPGDNVITLTKPGGSSLTVSSLIVSYVPRV